MANVNDSLNNFKSYDGTQMYGETFINLKSKKWILVFPGFGIGLDNKGPLRRMIQKIKDSGYNVIAINLRGHRPSEGEFSYDEMKKDIVYFVNKFYKQHKNLLVFGHSISATGLLDASCDINNKVKFVLFAPVINVARFPGWFSKLIIKMSNNKLLTYTILRFMLFVANLKTTNIKYIGIKKSFSYYGWCWIGKQRIKELIKNISEMSFKFHKIKQKGLIIYGSEDPLLKQIMTDYEENISRTTLQVKKVDGMKHHFKTWLKRNEQRVVDILIDSLVDFDMKLKQ